MSSLTSSEAVFVSINDAWLYTHSSTALRLINESKYRVAEKSHYRMIKNVSKPANEIRFIHQVKVPIKHYNVIR